MKTIREQLVTELEAILPPKGKDRYTSARIGTIIKDRQQRGVSEITEFMNRSTMTYYLSMLVLDPTSPVAKVDGHHGYYKRPYDERPSVESNTQATDRHKTIIECLRLIESMVRTGDTRSPYAKMSSNVATMDKIREAEPLLWRRYVDREQPLPELPGTIVNPN